MRWIVGKAKPANNYRCNIRFWCFLHENAIFHLCYSWKHPILEMREVVWNCNFCEYVYTLNLNGRCMQQCSPNFKKVEWIAKFFFLVRIFNDNISLNPRMSRIIYQGNIHWYAAVLSDDLWNTTSPDLNLQRNLIFNMQLLLT